MLILVKICTGIFNTISGIELVRDICKGIKMIQKQRKEIDELKREAEEVSKAADDVNYWNYWKKNNYEG